MPPLKDFQCNQCQAETKDFLYRSYDEIECPACGSKDVQLQFSYAANYTIGGDNSASVRPQKSKATKESGK